MNTQPMPPSVLAPTDVPPFTNVGVTGEPPGVCKIPDVTINDLLSAWIYLKNIQVTSSMNYGARVMEFISSSKGQNVLVDGAPPIAPMLNCIYSGTFMTQVKIIPVKLPSSRCSFNWTLSYLSEYTSPPATAKAVTEQFMDSGSFSLDEGEEFQFDLVPFFNGLPVRLSQTTDADLPHGSNITMIPTVTLRVSIRQPYIPNQLQPNSFDLIVLYRTVPTSVGSWIVEPYNRFAGLAPAIA